MGILTGLVGFVITLIMLRRKGSVGRHIGAFVLGMGVSLLLFGAWIGEQLSHTWVGNYTNEWMARVWAFGIVAGLVWQGLAMLIAWPLRRRKPAQAA
jgi:hypothetical protein